MLDIIYLSLYITFPVLIFFLMRYFQIELFRVTIPSFVILAMFILAYIGTLPLYFGWDSYRYNSGVQDKTLMFNVFLFTSWSILNLVLGFAFVKKVFGFELESPVNQSFRPLTNSEEKLLILLFLFCLSVLFIYLIKIPKLALWEGITKGVRIAMVARSKMGNAFSGKYHWYSLIMRDLLSVITYTFFANWLSVKNWTKSYYFVLALLFAGFSTLMATEKHPFVYLITGLFLVYLLIKKNGKLPLFGSLRFFAVIFTVLVILYIYFMGSPNVIAALSATFSRFFAGEIHPAYYYLEFFPKHHAFLWGQSLPNPGGILPFEPFNLAVEVMNWRFPDVAKSGVVGSMPTVFWGELYANFGIIGVVVGPFFTGVMVYLISFLVNKLESTPLKIGFYVWLILHYMNLSSKGVSPFIFDFYLVGILFFISPVLWLTAIQTKLTLGKK